MPYHKLRVTIATYANVHGDVGVEVLQKTLNHRSVETTKRYIKDIPTQSASLTGLAMVRNLQVAQGTYRSKKRKFEAIEDKLDTIVSRLGSDADIKRQLALAHQRIAFLEEQVEFYKRARLS